MCEPEIAPRAADITGGIEEIGDSEFAYKARLSQGGWLFQ